MPQQTINDTGLSVGPICFGTSGIGDMPDTYGYSVDDDRANAALHAIFEGPVNFLDTSNNYGMGRSEARIGAENRSFMFGLQHRARCGCLAVFYQRLAYHIHHCRGIES